jgi:ABC-2 type transport system permease protein
VSGLLVLAPLALAYPFIRDYITFPDELWRLVIGLPAVVLSAMIQFSIAYCFGLLTFWFLEIQGFVILSLAIETVLGGQMFPLDLMPDWVFRLAQYLPFYYQMYFPAAIFTGRIDYALAVQGLGVQLLWVVALLLLNHFLWARGLRRHTAVGG